MSEIWLNCTTCKHFTSFYEEYDFDELEPQDYGRCDEDVEPKEDEHSIGEYYVCKLWETA